ncbi:MAG: NAD(+)/NADH kinase [Actinobacteria bacterium]|nr:NAD(+)/NADH kinase [Actinomycetota bacterium]
MKVSNVSLVVHEGKRQALDLEKQLLASMGERGVAVVESGPDLVISLGGDGTVLRAARVAHEADAPLLAVNLGTLGYLTEVDAAAAPAALDRIFAGDFEIEDRMMLGCEARSVDGTDRFVGLNEVLVERSSRHRLVRLDVSVSGERLATFNADGVIVATPTGSTAYALSAGGPIVSPRAECILVVPVSPHMIFSRPVVLSPRDVVDISVGGLGHEHPQEASVVLDGRLGRNLGTGDSVTVRRHDRPLRLVRMAGPGFLERLRSKLDLPS